MQHEGSGSLTRNWTPGPLHWEHRVLATGPPVKSLMLSCMKLHLEMGPPAFSSWRSPKAWSARLCPGLCPLRCALFFPGEILLPLLVQTLSHVWHFVIPSSTAGLHHLPELAQTHVHWVSDAIQPSVIPFSPCFQSFPAPGSLLTSWIFASGAQRIGASALASVFLMNIQDWFPLGLTGLISLESKGLSRVFPNTTDQKHQFFLLLKVLICWPHKEASPSHVPFEPLISVSGQGWGIHLACPGFLSKTKLETGQKTCFGHPQPV